MLPPQPEHHRGDLRERYFAETQPGTSVALWESFCNLLADFRIQECWVDVDDFESATWTEWESEFAKVPADLNVPREMARGWEAEWAQTPALPDSTEKYLARGFLTQSAWSGKLADYYANLHRSAFVLNYGFGVLAVFFAVLAFCCWRDPWTSKGLVFAELASLIIIVALWARSRRRQWHDRWIDYRLLAELLRVQRFLAPLGGSAPLRGPVRTSLTVIRGTPGSTGISRPSCALPACRRRKLMQRTCAPIGGSSRRSWLSINGSTTKRASNDVYLDC